MIIDSKYNKSFVSNNLTATKYKELEQIAINIREHKNIISKEVNNSLFFFLEMDKFSFLKYFRNLHKGELSFNFDAQAYVEVYTCYQNKFSNIQKQLSFEKITYLGLEFYKKKTNKNEKGDFKKVNTKKEKTPLSMVLTYLSRYGNESTVFYIKKQLENKNIKLDKLKYYNNILFYIEKFGFDRLYSLSLSKRNRIIEKYSKKPIEFKSLSFGGRSRKKIIVDYNKNYNSIINSFVSLSSQDRKSLDIPVKFSKVYHGNMKDYRKSNPDYEYRVIFDEKFKKVSINLCKDEKRFIPEISDKDKVIGIDVNIKHNLFSLSNGESYDYNRQFVSEYCKLSTEIDCLKQKDKDYKVGKRKQWKLDTLRKNMKSSNQQLISSICKDLQMKGVRHVVMENLDNGFGKSFVKDFNNNNINFNRIVKFIGISSLKDEFEHIGRNYDIGVSTVHSCYTSKMCSICGCIDDDNRPSQEEFHCIKCGYESNADINASINIKDRVLVTVLRDKLLKQLDNGTFIPKVIKRDKVKEVLLSFRGSK